MQYSITTACVEYNKIKILKKGNITYMRPLNHDNMYLTFKKLEIIKK